MAALRQLPPAATPMTVSDLRQGFVARQSDVHDFARALSSYLGVPSCYPMSSGRSGLALLLVVLARRAPSTRREVVLPAYTCPSLVKVILDAQLTPRPVDVSPRTLGMVEKDLAAALGSRTLAVIHVHPFGIPQPIDQVLAWSRAVQAVVIEDAAQAMGSRLAGRQAGAWGDYGLYSLGPGKPLSVGGGGVLSLNGAEDLAEIETAWRALPPSSRLASASAHLRLAAYSLAFRPQGWWLATRLGLGRVADREEAWAYKMARLSASQARVGLEMLPRLDQINTRRRTRGAELARALSGLDYAQVPVVEPSAEPIYLRWPVLIEDADRRELIYRHLWSSGIGVGKMYQRSLPDLFPLLQNANYPGARFIAEHLLTLPTHFHVTDRDVEMMADVFLSARATKASPP